MESSFYVIDPDGDLLLVLEERFGKIHLNVIKTELDAASTPGTLVPNEEPGDEEANGSIANGRQQQVSLRSSALIDALLNGDTHICEGRIHKIRVLVSSKHLTLASKYFHDRLNAMLDFSESDVIPACASERDALLILLDVLHCQTRKVPRFITSRMLFMVAVLANHYGCVEAVEAFAEVWLDNLKDQVPNEYTDDLPRWIFISWVFRDGEMFQEMTSIAVRESIGPMPCLALPMIPDSLVRTIEKIRQDSIGNLVRSLYKRTESVLHSGSCCDDCDKMILGTLIRHLQIHQLYPPPMAPFHGFSVHQFHRFLNSVPRPRCNELIHPVNGCSETCELLPDTNRVFYDTLEATVGLMFSEVL
ncbi:hypothetical protein EYZ11_003013 [Aspergillus tanneri]|uniref:BTB domain-containing protein n=1 Tax=Aspergillus tanneri TaxID=1220188 RepID=A0A4S3JP91_9EURO|nr:hypothetical protein EYZ11_003013 [Aspergillus tanneri]